MILCFRKCTRVNFEREIDQVLQQVVNCCCFMKLACHQAMRSDTCSVVYFAEECGVVHTHDNRKVIGASRIEDHVSRCAIEDVYDKQQLSQVPAIQCDPLSEVRRLC